jgi:transposase
VRRDRINPDSGYCALSCQQDNAHVRRKFFDLYEALQSPLAKEALERIGQLYGIEAAIRGRSAEERLAHRQQHAVPLLASLHAWMVEQSARVEKVSTLAGAFNYAFNNWDALQRYTQDGRLEIDKAMISYCTSLVDLSGAGILTVH